MAQNIFLSKTEIGINEDDEIRPKLGYVEPYEGESISHYLGRLRRFKAILKTVETWNESKITKTPDL